MTAQSTLVEMSGVCRTFAHSSRPVHAVRDVSLRIERAEYLALVGRSGSGKSSLLNLLGLLDVPDGGRYVLAGRDTAAMGDGERSSERGHRIGFVFQAFHLMPDRTAAENVAMAMIYQGVGKRQRHETAADVLNQVGLAHRIDFEAKRLSGGEKQRVAVARALVNRPDLLLCDEPTGNLDQQSSDAILRLLDDIRSHDQAIVVVTHDIDVSRRADRVLTMADGRLDERS